MNAQIKGALLTAVVAIIAVAVVNRVPKLKQLVNNQ
jgi:hypothetical protein